MGELSPELLDEFMIWRIVGESNERLEDVRNWDLPMIVRFNDMLDMKADMASAQAEASRPKKKEKG